ncbi:MAG: ABC transporter ATP-binding protein/permease [Bacteroidales bacterium]|nr:ABC transporter ATP-binding protein/permease [Clostridium sp.]MCM1204082.1 ABC transporter ATP-binding protein/permease [Bacteroidales bacterium]
MYKITNYLKEYKKESIIAPLFKMLEASFELFVPLVMAEIVDTGIKNQDSGYILRMGGVLLLLAAIGLTCSITAQYFAAKASVGFGKSVRKDLFAHINSLSYAELDQAGTSTLITRMTNDINQLQSGVNMFLRLFLRSPFIVIGAMIMAFTVDVKAALVFVVAIPLLSLVVFGIMLYSIPLYQRVQKALDYVLLMTRENLVGARVIRAFCRQEDEKRDYREGSDGLMQMQTFVGKISAVMNPVTYIIVNAAIIVIIWVGGVQVNAGSLTQGEVIALVNYMSQILVELVKLANLIILLTKAAACSKRVAEVFAMEPSVVEQGSGVDIKRVQDKVVFQHVTFAYRGAKEPALKDISFTAKEGQTIGIIGGTGCGKSTLVNLIPRFYDVTEGAVLVDKADVKRYPFQQLRNRIGIVPQKAVLFNGTIAENLKWGKEDATREEMERAIKIAQAEDVIASKASGFEEMILQGGKNLSGGQRQRLTIARALVKEPEILILDDSASALDFATDARLRKAIREETKGMTVFIVSQRASTIKQADQIIVLEDGSMAGIGTHQELMQSCEVYQEIVRSQEDGQSAGGRKETGGGSEKKIQEEKEEKQDGR